MTTTDLPTLILRHRKENLKKCSLRGLETRSDMRFFTYPKSTLPPLNGYVLLTLDAPELTAEDADFGLFLVDGTWRYAEVMLAQIPSVHKRRLPSHFKTAYPRVQTGCVEPKSGLASLEALYIAYHITGRCTDGLLDHYYWKDQFLQENASFWEPKRTE